MEIRDILVGIEKERSYENFISWIHKVFTDFEKNAELLDKEYFLKLKDSQKEDMAKKYREEILPLAIMLEKFKDYFRDFSFIYNVGDQPYDAVAIKGSKIYYIEIVTAFINKEILIEDKELFERGMSGSPQISVETTIGLIKKALKHKVNKEYKGDYILLIVVDDKGFSRARLKESFEEKIKETVWDKGNFRDVFVVGTWQSISNRLE